METAAEIANFITDPELGIPELALKKILNSPRKKFLRFIAKKIFENGRKNVTTRTKHTVPERLNLTSPKIPDNPSVIGHIFQEKKIGHVANIPENRRTLENLAKDPKALLGKDKRGNIWHARTESNGSQTWATSRNGKIWDGGVNNKPLPFNKTTGLKQLEKPYQREKND